MQIRHDSVRSESALTRLVLDQSAAQGDGLTGLGGSIMYRMRCQDEEVQHLQAPPGKATKYARLERERRFLMAGIPEGPCIRRAEIADLYFTDTRLRLRRTVEVMSAGSSMFYKLTQKIPAPSIGPGLITTFYLEEAEYQALRSLPSVGITKTRYSIPPLSIDVFSGKLTGLVMAEAEFESAEQEAQFQIPVDSPAEVTTDIRFSGGRLAHMVRLDLLALLTVFGLEPLDSSELASRSLSATTG